jgi:BirA family biotin operon repressor/biotin-[acetyl-CoA-carboxylase] ligase
VADEQTAGRGQGSNAWFATPGANLSFSLVCYPDHLSVDQIFALTQVPALAVAAVVRELIKPPVVAAVSLKWPNDVYVGDQKIAGILVQNGLRGKAIAWSVIGIGLNVNEVNFPSELTTVATSLRLLTGRQLDRQAVRDRLFEQLRLQYSLTTAAGMGQLQRDYHRQLYRLNLPGRYQRTNDNSTFFAILRGVAADGRLVLEHASGEEERFALREVRFI